MPRIPFIFSNKHVFYFPVLFIALMAFNCRNKETGTGYKPVFSSDTSQSNTLIFGLPSFSYSETAEPFIGYLNTRLPRMHVKLKACLSFDEYLNDLESKKFDLTLINGIQALDAVNKGYSIIAKVIDDKEYCGVIFTRRDGEITKIEDLKNKKIAYISSATIPGIMMPLYYMYQHGLDLKHDITQVRVPSFESAIIATYVGKSDAGVCLKRSWDVYTKDHPEVLSRVEVKWKTEPLINNAVLVKSSMDRTLKEQIEESLFSMSASAQGREALKMLEFSGFEKAGIETYKPMADFKKRYDAAIR